MRRFWEGNLTYNLWIAAGGPIWASLTKFTLKILDRLITRDFPIGVDPVYWANRENGWLMAYVSDFPNKEIPKKEILMDCVSNILMASDHVTVRKNIFNTWILGKFSQKREVWWHQIMWPWEKYIWTHKISEKKKSKKGNFDGLCNMSCDSKKIYFPKKAILMAYISNSKIILLFRFPFLESISLFGITIKGNYISKKSEKYQKNPKKYWKNSHAFYKL